MTLCQRSENALLTQAKAAADLFSPTFFACPRRATTPDRQPPPRPPPR